MKVYVEGDDSSVEKLFKKKGFEISEANEADIIVFTGGEDVSPHLYGEVKLDCTHTSPERDKFCVDLFKESEKKIKVGICRGAQFLNVMNGGKMYQDVDGHTKYHNLISIKGESFGEVTSTHHQMMIPHTKGLVMAVAEESFYRRRAGATVIGTFRDDTEVVRYIDTNSLCFQPHPEYNHKNTADLFWVALSIMGNKELTDFLKEGA